MKDTERKESMAAGDDEPPSKAPIDTHSQDGPNPAAPTCVSRAKGILIKAYDLACEHWFILGIGLAIGLAAAVPSLGKNGGWIRAEYTIKYGAVIVIFLLSGLSLKSKVLLQAASRAHVHLFIQLLCLGLTPLIGFGLYTAMKTASWMNTSLLSGLVAGGNAAVALINAVVGNIIGIFVSPGLLTLYVQESGQAPYGKVLQQLGLTVIAPLAVGQVIQYLLPKVVAWLQARVNFGKVSNVMILLLVFNTFSNTFAADISVGAGSLVVVLIVILLLYPFFSLVCLGAAWGITLVPWLQRWFKLTRADMVAVIMCGATKTLALGVPLLSVLYGGSPDLALLALPLIIYHAVQILQGNLAIPVLKRWVESEQALPLHHTHTTTSSGDINSPSLEPTEHTGKLSRSSSEAAVTNGPSVTSAVTNSVTFDAHTAPSNTKLGSTTDATTAAASNTGQSAGDASQVGGPREPSEANTQT